MKSSDTRYTRREAVKGACGALAAGTLGVPIALLARDRELMIKKIIVQSYW